MFKEKAVQLSKRLTIVSNMVTVGNKVADVGCDHAYTAISLIQNKIAASVIALDVNEGPLLRAKENIDMFGLSNEIEARRSDGLKQLTAGEIDTILISGMGGPLMKRILLEGKAVVDSCKELVLQPQSEIHEVRDYLREEGFEIMAEDMVIEDGKYYVVIKAEKTSKKMQDYTETELLYGKYLLENKNKVLHQYLQKEREKTKQLQRKLRAKNTEKSQHRIEELENKQQCIEEGLKYYEM